MLVFDLVERGIERVEVLLRDVLRRVAGCLQQADLDLQGRVRKLAQDLRLGDDLGGHEVEQHQLQRADVLMDGSVLRHHEDVLTFEDVGGGQCVGYLDGHGETSDKPR